MMSNLSKQQHSASGWNTGTYTVAHSKGHEYASGDG